MLHSLISPLVGAVNSACPLHYCQYDANGCPALASYDLGADAVDLPSGIHAAYGVRAHADMPHGIYRRMEQQLALSNGAAGYYYCEDGAGKTRWISVSLFPTSAGIMACHFEVTSKRLVPLAQFFAQLSASERASAARQHQDIIAPDVAASQLIELLKDEGLPDYRAMSLEVMIDEVFGRYEGQRRPQFRELKALYHMCETLQVIDRFGTDVGVVSERSKLIPYQLKLQAARLESGKGPIGVIASNHQELTGSLLKITDDIHRASCNEIDRVSDALAYLAQSNHAAELINQGPTCASRDPLPDVIKGALSEIIVDCAKYVEKVLAGIDKSACALIAISKRMRRSLSAMEMTRLMCKVEQANIEGPTEGLENIVSHLETVENDLYAVMVQIDDAAKAALVQVKHMNHHAAHHTARHTEVPE